MNGGCMFDDDEGGDEEREREAVLCFGYDIRYTPIRFSLVFLILI